MIGAAYCQTMARYNRWMNEKLNVLCEVLVVHLFNHQIHHRGQLTTLLAQLGYDPGDTDLHKFPGLATLVE